MAADQSSEKEVLEAESPGSASDLNRSDLDPIYIGGLPASRPIRSVADDDAVMSLDLTVSTCLTAFLSVCLPGDRWCPGCTWAVLKMWRSLAPTSTC